jgi:DHA1 family multidrug resistance protein-like MFS transporter
MGHAPGVQDAKGSSQGGSRRLTIAFYLIAVFFYWIALYLYMPTLPTYVKSKSDNLAIVGVVLSMYGLGQAMVRLPIGVIADWLGRRRPFILAGFALAGLGAWVMGISGGVEGLLAGRAITGLAAGTWTPLVALFSAHFPPQEVVRASALLTLVGSAGRLLATSATGSLNELGGHSLAFFLAAGSAGLAILMMLPSKDIRRAPRRPSLKGVASLITRREVLLPALLSMVAQHANWGATFGFVPILAKDLGATDVAQSMLMSMNTAIFMVGNLAATAALRWVRTRPLVYFGFVLLSAGMATAAFAGSLPLVFVAQGCIGLAQGIGHPVLMGLSIRPVADGERTTAAGLHQSVYAIGMFSGPVVSGMLADAMGIRPMLAMTAFVCLALGVLAVRWLSD